MVPGAKYEHTHTHHCPMITRQFGLIVLSPFLLLRSLVHRPSWLLGCSGRAHEDRHGQTAVPLPADLCGGDPPGAREPLAVRGVGAGLDVFAFGGIIVVPTAYMNILDHTTDQQIDNRLLQTFGVWRPMWLLVVRPYHPSRVIPPCTPHA